jgi:hypothetical protein
MPITPSILLFDDGELFQVKEILEGLRMEFVQLAGTQVSRGVECTCDVLVTSCTRAFDLAEIGGWPNQGEGPVWICVYDEDLLPFRDRLREMGVHYAVQSAVDRESLRLLFLHTLYQVSQNRREPCLSIVIPARFRIGPLSRPATLTDLSSNGCRLISSHWPAPSQPVSVHLLPDLRTGGPLELPGTVVRVELAHNSEESGQVLIGVNFDATAMQTRERLQMVLEARLVASPVTCLRESEVEQTPGEEPTECEGVAAKKQLAPPSAARESLPGVLDIESDRRANARASYVQSVPACIGDAPRIILGRDLSIEGMRIEPHPDFPLGSAVRVALYRGEHDEPLTLDARVARDDGERGLLLRFSEMKPEAALALEKLVSELPALESVPSTDGDDQAIVVSTLAPLD